jgi:quinol monooxygenase YgiN
MRRISTGALTLSLTLLFSNQAAADCNPEEVGYVATFQVKEGSEAEFEAAISTLAETVNRLESGVVLYAPFKGADNVYYMMERYQDEAARKAHATADEVRALFPSLGPLMAAPADVQPVSAVCP